jgi:hypothetical protein
MWMRKADVPQSGLGDGLRREADIQTTVGFGADGLPLGKTILELSYIDFD